MGATRAIHDASVYPSAALVLVVVDALEPAVVPVAEDVPVVLVVALGEYAARMIEAPVSARA